LNTALTPRADLKLRKWLLRRRGHELPACEAQFVKLLEAEGDEFTATASADL
jgi:hypothetical protein